MLTFSINDLQQAADQIVNADKAFLKAALEANDMLFEIDGLKEMKFSELHFTQSTIVARYTSVWYDVEDMTESDCYKTDTFISWDGESFKADFSGVIKELCC